MLEVTVTREQGIAIVELNGRLDGLGAARLDAAAENSLRERIRREVDAGMTLEVNHVDAIRRTVSGKHRFVICELA